VSADVETEWDARDRLRSYVDRSPADATSIEVPLDSLRSVLDAATWLAPSTPHTSATQALALVRRMLRDQYPEDVRRIVMWLADEINDSA
jgi:hypothetical protein